MPLFLSAKVPRVKIIHDQRRHVSGKIHRDDGFIVGGDKFEFPAALEDVSEQIIDDVLAFAGIFRDGLKENIAVFTDDIGGGNGPGDLSRRPPQSAG